MNKKTVIVVAGGSGQRMGASIPKQFLEIGGKAILLRTLENFIHFDPEMQVILALPEDQMDYWKELTTSWPYANKVQVVKGGTERFYSVKNALKAVSPKCEKIAVHDGVRPFISSDLIRRGFDCINGGHAAIPVIPSKDSIRVFEPAESYSKSVDRNTILHVQTPQVFDANTLLNAYKQDFSESFTDDASVVEKMGEKIELFKGNELNFKITSPEDLEFAEYIISKKK